MESRGTEWLSGHHDMNGSSGDREAHRQGREEDIFQGGEVLEGAST